MQEQRIRGVFEDLRKSIRRIQALEGYAEREDGTTYILQDAYSSTFVIHEDDCTINLNSLDYFVDNQLIIDGWNPCDVMSLDKNYFKNRHEKLSCICFSKIKEKRSLYKTKDKSCMVIYGRK